MKTIYIKQQDKTADSSPVIREAIERYEGDVEIIFETGVYRMFSAVEIRGKEHIVLNGNGSRLLAHFDREQDVDASTEVFHFENSRNIILKGFVLSSDMPANSLCKIQDVAEDHVDIEAMSSVPFNGNEYYIDGMAVNYSEDDPERMGENRCIGWLNTEYDPAKTTVIANEIACTNPRRLNVPHESLGGQQFRVYPKSFHSLKNGMYAIIQHSYYGLVAFIFRNCENVLIEDVHLANYGGFGFAILPRCKDFTFRRVRFESEDKKRQPYSINADGIHITGLSGQLLLEDCYFEALGDDTINIHTQVMDVAEVQEDSFRIIYAKKNGIVSPVWGFPGDTLKFYDPVTLAEKGEVVIKSISDGWIVPEILDFEIKAGDLLTNQRYYPETIVRRVCVKKQRNRSLCIQGVSSLLVEDCDFSHIANASIYLSTAFNKWREAGPVRNVVIRNNHFTNALQPIHRTNKLGVIQLWLNGEHFGLPHVHKNILIENNTFTGFNRPIANLSSGDGIIIRNNIMENCEFGEEEPVVLVNCSEVTVTGNTFVSR